MNFKHWLNEAEQKGFGFYKDLILDILDLDKTSGLSTTIATFDQNDLIDKLNKMGEFESLDPKTKEEVIAKIKSKKGLLSDLVAIMSQQAEETE